MSAASTVLAPRPSSTASEIATRVGKRSAQPPIVARHELCEALRRNTKLYHLRERPRRFNELRRLIPKVTQRMLTQHLRELEADGVVIRTVHEKVPPHVEYSFSARGRTLLPLLDAMAEWGRANDGDIVAPND